MVRNYLKEISEREDNKKEDVIKKLKKSFSKSNVKVGKVRWRRDDLYDR